MSMTQSPQRSSTQAGVQDKTGWGFAGLTLGIVGGFLAAFYFVVPLFPKVKATGNVTMMTVVVVAAMTIGGAIGYIATRRRT